MKTKPAETAGAAQLRAQAEKKLSAQKKKGAPQPPTQAESLRLVQELEVHQIELEMQNEELERIRAELEEALKKYKNLYDFAPVGYIILAGNDVIRQINLAGASLLGLERSKLIGKRLGVFVSDESRSIFNEFFETLAFAGGRKACELLLENKERGPVWVTLDAACLEGDGVSRVTLSDITDRKQADDALKHASTHDLLTGLYNRNFFMEEMARLERGRGFPISIVVADVDDMKGTNDRQGHAAGDMLLKLAAQALTTAFRAEDMIARTGGDEFVVLMPGTGAVTAEASVERVRKVLDEINVSQIEFPIHLSLGVSTTGNPEQLAKAFGEADTNMYREKRGKNASKK
jgi:diguanylate cyclase (GGDEF)-like protein/PAS domain S-box-containing protein